MRTCFTFFFILISYSGFAQLQSLMNVKTWAYQLQNINISQIAADTSFKLIVIDYSSDGTDESKFTPQEISQIKASGKKVISYISIGEAEDYRYYWQSSWITTPPAWLGAENPDWPGNYKVKFWDPQWQNIIFSYVDTIINQGFDGIYMDIIDAYYYWMVENPQKPDADSLMVRFVRNIRDHVNTVTGNTDFIMIPQNAEDIVNSTNVTPAQKTAYFNTVNAIGVEDVFCYGNLDEDNQYNPDTYRINQLQEYLTNGKQVFSIEYLTQANLISQYVNGAHSNNFVPYVCVRALDQLCPGIPAGLEEIINLPTGQAGEENISLYPNPSTGGVFLSGNNLDKKSVILVFSSLGCLIKKYSMNELNISGNELSIDMSAFSEGVYFLKVFTKTGIECKRIVICQMPD
ncbi:MAG: MJ1477/TM1410 family putative glycoside hydrolase [Bacteroidales bacterium]